MRYLAFALLASCGVSYGHDPLCVSRCGMSFYGLPEGGLPDMDYKPRWTCHQFQDAEDTTLAAFANVGGDPRFTEACKQVNGLRVFLHHFEAWQSPQHKYPIAGETRCEVASVQVGNKPWHLSSLAHEMAHYVQRCEPTKPHDTADYYHSNWTSDGINSALRQVFLTVPKEYYDD